MSFNRIFSMFLGFIFQVNTTEVFLAQYSQYSGSRMCTKLVLFLKQPRAGLSNFQVSAYADTYGRGNLNYINWLKGVKVLRLTILSGFKTI